MPRKLPWSDEKWHKLNHELINALRESDWFRAHQIYYQIALYLQKYDKDFSTPLAESRKCRVRYFMNQKFVSKVEIMAFSDSCDLCKSLHGKRYSFQEALSLSPLPVKQCKNGICRCLYNGVME
jgi:hypothetical protein